MLFADAALARRIEGAEAAIARGCARKGAAALDVAGGCAIFMGAESPLTQAVGIGLNGPVSEAEIGWIESFFRSRGAKVKLDLCPLADPGLLEALASRGYSVLEFNNVLARRLTGAEAESAPRVRRLRDGEGELWSDVVGRGFFETATLSPEEMDVGRAIVAMPGAMCYLGLDEGQPAGGAAMAVWNGLAMLFGDSALAASRRRGLHRELIAARLAEARSQGCDLAAASTLPGSASQRNYERMGFEVVYTRAALTH
ncbi:MAG: GNAT family N-acetyltransferase [Acidobacteriia bacterium]|nr:GNAT family N-acetyltransferase [Terriglobia bacterium]